MEWYVMLDKDRYPSSFMLIRQEMIQEIMENFEDGICSREIAEMYAQRHAKFFVQMAQHIVAIRREPTPDRIRSAYLTGLRCGMPTYLVYTVLTEAFINEPELLRAMDNVNPYTLQTNPRIYVH